MAPKIWSTQCLNIEYFQALRGPNFWSHKIPKLIQVRLELDPNINFSKDDIKLIGDELSFQIDDSTQNEQNLINLISTVSLQLQNKCGCKLSFFDSKKTNYNRAF